MSDAIKGKNNSYFHNNMFVARPEDKEKTIISLTQDDVICHLNGYAIIPVEEYYLLKGEKVPEGTTDKIMEMNRRLEEI